MNIIFFHTTADGFCLASAILTQIVVHTSYTPEMAMRQAGLHMIRHPRVFYPYVEQELIETGESYESFCFNVFHGNCWGDDLIAAVFSHMWNLAITIVSPALSQPVDLFHTKEEPDIVIVCNGGSYMAEDRRSTHFSATKINEVGYRKPGEDLVNNTPGINPELTYKKLKPGVLCDGVKAKSIAINEYLSEEKEKSLEMLYTVTKSIERLDKHIASQIKESERKKEMKKTLEFKMEQLGISVEKIKAVSQHKDLPYVLTDEADKEEILHERKRKREEEEKEE